MAQNAPKLRANPTSRRWGGVRSGVASADMGPRRQGTSKGGKPAADGWKSPGNFQRRTPNVQLSSAAYSCAFRASALRLPGGLAGVLALDVRSWMLKVRRSLQSPLDTLGEARLSPRNPRKAP